MDWFARGLFGDRALIEILPGFRARVWYEAYETTTGMFVVVEKLRLICDWLPW